MADIAKIRLNNTLYPLKDEYARNLALEGKEIADNALDISEYNENVIGGYNAPLCVMGYDDLPVASVSHTIQGGCIDGNLLYVAETTTFPLVDIRVYDLVSNTLVNVIRNIQGYHANDMCIINGKLYIAQCYANAGGSPSRTITVYNITAGTSSFINIFESYMSTGGMWGISKYDDDKIIVGIGTVNDDDHFYIYNLTNNTVVSLTTTLPTTVKYVAVQNLDYYDGKIYVTVSGTSGILKYDVEDNNVKFCKYYMIPAYDANNVRVGEVESISFWKANPNFAVIVSISKAYGNSPYTVNMYMTNLETGVGKYIIPTVIEHYDMNTGGDVTVNSSYTGLFENGSSTYPFKALGRAISNQTRTHGSYIEMEAGTYDLGAIQNCDVHIKLNGDVVIRNPVESGLRIAGSNFRVRNEWHTLTFDTTLLHIFNSLFYCDTVTVTGKTRIESCPDVEIDGYTSSINSLAVEVVSSLAYIEFTSVPNTSNWCQVSGHGKLWTNRTASSHIATPGNRWWVAYMGA